VPVPYYWVYFLFGCCVAHRPPRSLQCQVFFFFKFETENPARCAWMVLEKPLFFWLDCDFLVWIGLGRRVFTSGRCSLIRRCPFFNATFLGISVDFPLFFGLFFFWMEAGVGSVCLGIKSRNGRCFFGCPFSGFLPGGASFRISLMLRPGRFSGQWFASGTPPLCCREGVLPVRLKFPPPVTPLFFFPLVLPRYAPLQLLRHPGYYPAS